MALNLKVNLFVALLVLIESVLNVGCAPVLTPKLVNATRKLSQSNSLQTTTVAPIQLTTPETNSTKKLSFFDEILSIIKEINPVNKDVSIQNSANSSLIRHDERQLNVTLATEENPVKLAINSSFSASKQYPKQKSQMQRSEALQAVPSNREEKSASNGSRGTAGANAAGSRKPRPIADATFTAIPTNKTVGKHSNASVAVTQRATLNDVMGFLQKFGYLEGRFGNQSEAVYAKETVDEAISHMQRFGGLRPTGVIDNATLELMVTPRCGNKDVESGEGSESRRRKRFVIGAPGWNKRRLTYFLANWSPKIGSEETTLNELKRAFKVWSEYAHLKFVQVPTPDADIVILFGHGYHGDRYPFDGPGFTLAHAYYPYEYAHLGGDVHFDEDEPWTVAPAEGSSAIDFFTVATHELGHSLGLAHSPVQGSIMFPYYKGYQPNLHLDYDDILAMYQLYISRHVHDNRDGEEEATTSTTTSSTSSTSTTSTTAAPPTTPTTKATTSFTEEVDDRFDWDDKTHDESEEDDVITTTKKTINYHGDYETVDDHKRKQNASSSNVPELLPVPDICDGYFDAVSAMRNELFFFKGQYVWRLGRRLVINDGYPIHFRHLFRELPHTLTKIDAVYERPDGCIVFFSGDRYWVFNGDRMVEQNMPLSYLGLPDGLQQLDAALVWGKNKKTYFFSKNLYWRYDDVKRQMDAGYPHDVSRWRGVPADIDAAMRWTDGNTYFFKSNLFWRFDDTLVRIDGRYPLEAAPYWLACPEQE